MRLTPSQSSSSVESGLIQAVRRFKNSYNAYVNIGGVDVCCLGTSLTRGLNDPTHFRTGWVHRLKVALQGWLNPDDVPGGYGYMRTYDAVGGIRNDAAMTVSGTVTNTAGGTSLAFARMAQNATARTNRICWQFNGGAADAVAARRKITDLEFLVHGAGGGSATSADARIDLTLNAAPGLSDGQEYSENLDTSTLGSGVPGYRLTIGGLDRDANYFAQIGNGTTTPGSLNDVWSEGVIAYDGDYAAGVRVHNLGAPGVASASFASSQEMTANIGRFCTQSGSGARNASLFLLELDTNDIRTAVSAATHLANLTTVVDRILSQRTKPGIILVLMPLCADGAAGWLGASSGTAAALAIRANAYTIAASRANVGVIDLHEYTGGGAWYASAGSNVYLQNLQPRGWNESDLIHLSATAQADIAEYIYDAIRGAWRAA